MYLKKKDLGIVIPSYNEEYTIKKAYQSCSKFGEPLVINDCSSDKTLEILKKNNIKHLNNSSNLGYEKSVLKGINYFINKKKYVLTYDSDLQFDGNDIIKLYNIIKKKKLDVLIGARKRKNRISENILEFFFNIKYNIRDPISGLKIYRCSKIKKIIKLIKSDLFLVDLIKISFLKNLKIEYINIITKKRSDNSRVGNIFKANIKIFRIFYKLFLNQYD